MNYKGYAGDVTYDSSAKLFHGEVLELNDVITFQGTSVKELEKAFRDSIDDYLDWCKETEQKPEKTATSNRTISRLNEPSIAQ